MLKDKYILKFKTFKKYLLDIFNLSNLKKLNLKNLDDKFIFGRPVSSILRYSLLFLAFILFAAIPPYLLFLISSQNKIESEYAITAERVKLPSVALQDSSVALRVLDSENIQAKSGKDFLLMAWFKLFELPKAGERVILLRKYNPRELNLPGYALSLLRVKGGDIRLSIYWRNKTGLGGWEALEKFNVPPKEWFLLALSFIDDKFVGVHVLEHKDNNELSIKTMGGLKIEKDNFANSAGLLEFGARGNGKFRGRIGAVGAFYLNDFTNNYKEILNSHFQNPQKLADPLEDSEILLWSKDGREDLSSSNLKLRITRTGQFRKKDVSK